MMKDTSSVLIVDDDILDAELIARAFAKCGVKCLPKAVTSSVDALKYLQHHPPYHDVSKFPRPDLVTLDSKMPDSGKWDVLLWIRQQAGLRDLPVVVLCGSADPTDEQLALDLGANAYHTKPQTHEEFSRVIENIAKRWFPAGA